MWDGTLLAALNVDQNDTVALAGTEAWTGSNADGTGYTLFGGYQMGGGSGNSITGAVNSVSTTWMTNGGPNSANVRKVYAFSSPLIVPVPEPSTTAMLTAAVGSIIASQLRRLKRSNAPASSTRLSQRQSSTGIPASTF